MECLLNPSGIVDALKDAAEVSVMTFSHMKIEYYQGCIDEST